MGICTMGGGLGGVIFSVVLRFTTKNFEWTTASLIHFAIICAFLSLGCALTRPRVLKARKGKMWDFACFRRWKFVLFTFSVCGMAVVPHQLHQVSVALMQCDGRLRVGAVRSVGSPTHVCQNSQARRCILLDPCLQCVSSPTPLIVVESQGRRLVLQLILSQGVFLRQDRSWIFHR